MCHCRTSKSARTLSVLLCHGRNPPCQLSGIIPSHSGISDLQKVFLKAMRIYINSYLSHFARCPFVCNGLGLSEFHWTGHFPRLRISWKSPFGLWHWLIASISKRLCWNNMKPPWFYPRQLAPLIAHVMLCEGRFISKFDGCRLIYHGKKCIDSSFREMFCCLFCHNFHISPFTTQHFLLFATAAIRLCVTHTVVRLICG